MLCPGITRFGKQASRDREPYLLSLPSKAFSMDIDYFEKRLQAELRMVEMSTDICAKAIHQALVTAYRARLAALRRTAPTGAGASPGRVPLLRLAAAVAGVEVGHGATHH